MAELKFFLLKLAVMVCFGFGHRSMFVSIVSVELHICTSRKCLVIAFGEAWLTTVLVNKRARYMKNNPEQRRQFIRMSIFPIHSLG